MNKPLKQQKIYGYDVQTLFGITYVKNEMLGTNELMFGNKLK